MSTTTERSRLVAVILSSPLTLFAFLPLVVLYVLNSMELAVWAIVAWGVGAAIVLAVVGLMLPPQVFVAKTTLSSEVSKVGGLVRGGLGLFVAAIVGAVGAMAVQRDFTAETTGRGEIMTLLTLVGEVLVVVVTVRILYGIAFRMHIADPAARARAARHVMTHAFATVRGVSRLRAALRHPVFLHWSEVLSARGPYWMAATIASLATLLAVIHLIQWVASLQ